jgi:hypothetical protein
MTVTSPFNEETYFTDLITQGYSDRVSDRHTIGLSGIGKDERIISLEARFSWPDVPKPEAVMRFRLGDAVEEILCSVIPPEYRVEGGSQMRVVLNSGHVTGHFDDVLRLLEKDQTRLAEYKSSNQTRFRRLQKLGSYKEWDEGYYFQIQAYMGAGNELFGLDMDACHVVVMNKNNSELYEEVVPFDEVVWEQIKLKCENLVAMTSVPHPTMTPNDYRVKNFMTEEQKNIYLMEWTPPNPNCRNCDHSRRDLNDHEEKRGRWGCRRKRKVLTLEEQRVSCADHQWIPDLIPAMCIDEEKKEYQRDDFRFTNDVNGLSSEKIAWLCRNNWDVEGSQEMFNILDEFDGSLTL